MRVGLALSDRRWSKQGGAFIEAVGKIFAGGFETERGGRTGITRGGGVLTTLMRVCETRVREAGEEVAVDETVEGVIEIADGATEGIEAADVAVDGMCAGEATEDLRAAERATGGVFGMRVGTVGG